jgi:signal transduction histidine kinase
VSEALANALKHADAGRVEVEIGYGGGQLTLEVRDDGRGFDAAAAAGSGLRNMDDRVEALGGRLTVRGRPGEGAHIGARLPATARERAHA